MPMAFVGLRSAGPPEVSGDGPSAPMMPKSDVVSVLLENIRCLGASYGEFRCAPGWSLDQAASQDAHGFLVSGGSVLLTVAQGERHEIGGGEFALVAPGNAFQMRLAQPGATCAMAHVGYRLEPSRMRFLFRLLPPVMVLRGFTAAEFQWQQSLGPLISAQERIGGPGTAAILGRLIEASLMDVICMGLRHDPGLSRRFGDPVLRRIAPGLAAIHQTPQAAWSVAALARLGGLSRTAFSNAFLTHLGETPMRYLTGVRMDLARELLSSGEPTVAEVAHRCGYGADVAFARAFRRRFGCSPGRFRAEAIAQAECAMVGAASAASGPDPGAAPPASTDRSVSSSMARA